MSILSLLSSLPNELSKNLVEEFQKLHEQYFLGKWQVSQLNGGRFGEAVLRIIQLKDQTTYTPIGTQLPAKETIVSHAKNNTSIPKSLRLYVAEATCLIMDCRNDRDVAHLGSIDVNPMDATFVINTANWILAEIIRIEGHTTPELAQNEITKIIERRVPIVENIGGRLKVLNPNLTERNKVLVCLYQKYPEKVNEEKLSQWIKPANRTRFRLYLRTLDKEGLLDYSGEEAVLTRLGLLRVEKNIKFDIQV